MTPPEAHLTGSQDPEGPTPPAVSLCVDGAVRTLRNRRDFLAAARAKRAHMPGFVLQARKRGADDAAEAPIRIGYTCSKKVGNAVARNRAKRRLREVARAVLPQKGMPGWDYVLIGRAEVTATLPMPALCADLTTALTRLHGPR